ncbi:MAG: GNAT family N-acetyltransferase [Olleya sp.]
MNNSFSLKPIKLSNQSTLLALMQRIYPPAYEDFWENKDCSWYINKQYNPKQLKEELAVPNTDYYFINYKNENIGILRLIHDLNTKTTKLHRLYLDQNYQGLGLGTKAIQLSGDLAKQKGSKTIWLEAMDTKTQALNFYKKAGFKIIETYQLEHQLIHKHLRGMHKMTKQL